jgi:hypothetical protein
MNALFQRLHTHALTLERLLAEHRDMRVAGWRASQKTCRSYFKRQTKPIASRLRLR